MGGRSGQSVAIPSVPSGNGDLQPRKSCSSDFELKNGESVEDCSEYSSRRQTKYISTASAFPGSFPSR